jgi:hypothetical protein
VIPSPGLYATVTFGSLNDLGVVVGGSNVGGWIWDAADGTLLLNSLLAAPGANMLPGWNVTNALSISNSGLILAQASCNGGPVEYVELSATPGPSTCAGVAAPEASTGALAGAELFLALLARWTTMRSRISH